MAKVSGRLWTQRPLTKTEMAARLPRWSDGRAGDAGDADALGVVLDWQHRGGAVGPVDRGEGVAEIVVAGCGERSAAVVRELEGDAGIGERVVRDEDRDLARFGRDGVEELATRGKAPEEVADAEGRADRGRAGDVTDDARIDEDGEHAHWLGGRPREDLDVGGGGDGGECLAAEAERVHVAEVVEGGDLARGVALEGELELLRRDSAPVVGDADETEAAVFDFDGDARRAGVDGVVEQFADDGNRPFDHLAGGDAGRDFRWEDVDAGRAWGARCWRGAHFAGVGAGATSALSS